MNIKTQILLTLLSSTFFFGFGTCGGNDTNNDNCELATDCLADDLPIHDLPVDTPIDTAQSCEVTICLAGAIDQYSGGNQFLMEICERNEIQGLLEDCDAPDGKCFSAFDNFLPTSLYRNTVYPEFFSALDQNGDGLINTADPQCHVTVIGFSWGGVNAVRLANDFENDSRVTAERVDIDLLILLDPFQPGKQNKMKIPASVKKFVEFRHSVASRNDCSKGQFLGPYLGLRPECLEDADCTDYDFSLSEDIFAFGENGEDGYVKGNDIGHCSVARAAHEKIISLIQGAEYHEIMPPKVNIRRYAY